MNNKYALEFILHAKHSSAKIIQSSLVEFGSELLVSADLGPEESCNYKINIVTEYPTMIFDLCSQLGRIRSVKANESVV